MEKVLDFSESVSSSLISREYIVLPLHTHTHKSSVPFLLPLAQGYPLEGNCTENISVPLAPLCRGWGSFPLKETFELALKAGTQQLENGREKAFLAKGTAGGKA